MGRNCNSDCTITIVQLTAQQLIAPLIHQQKKNKRFSVIPTESAIFIGVGTLALF